MSPPLPGGSTPLDDAGTLSILFDAGPAFSTCTKDSEDGGGPKSFFAPLTPNCIRFRFEARGK